MIDQNRRYSPVLDPADEGEAHVRLIKHDQAIYKDGVNNSVDMIMATELFAERILDLQTVIGRCIFASVDNINFGVWSRL